MNAELSGAIRTIEMMLEKMDASEEICVSDIEAKLYEWRTALYNATKGNDPLFDEYDMYDVEIDGIQYRFKWPDDSFDIIKTFYMTGGFLFATSVGVNALPFSPDGLRPSDFRSCTTVCLGYHDHDGDVVWIEAGKTNLRRV